MENREDTISREAALEALAFGTAGDYDILHVYEVKDRIEALPPVQPQVEHGRLEATGYDELYCEFGNCTVCGAYNPMPNKYCRECGVKLDGGEDDG